MPPMLKRIAILALLAAAPTPGLADADQVRDRIVSELRKDDYREIRISRTLLGRMRFVAVRPGARREIVVNPVTGVILRDYIQYRDASGATSASQDDEDNGTSATVESSSDDDEADDDRDDDDDDRDDDEDDRDDDEDDDRDDNDDDDDEDNSGSGSSNSGSGSDDDDESDDDD